MVERNALSPKVFPEPWAGEWGEDDFGLWQALIYNEVKQVFRWIPPGRFWMGSPEDEEGRFATEGYFPEQIDSGFWLGETVVTEDFWRQVMSYHPGESPAKYVVSRKGQDSGTIFDLFPKVNIDSKEIAQFITRLQQLHPALYARLPTEYEWEYACRAGTSTCFNFGNELSLDRANYNGAWSYKVGNTSPKTQQGRVIVKSYPCNAWGLYEMHGNVWEYCSGGWHDRLDQMRELAEVGVLRGGSWSSIGRFLRSAARTSDEEMPDGRSDAVGFRLAVGAINSGGHFLNLLASVAEAE